MNDEYIAYGLYTEVEGVFYIGSGKAENGKGQSRLKGTVSECQKMQAPQPYPYYGMKCRYIRACQGRGIKIEKWIFCTNNEKKQAEEMEYALIQRYPYALTNFAHNPHPMKELPSFLYSKEYVRREHLGLAVDAIITYNDATSEPKQRWYINVAVVCDLVDAKQKEVKSYLASRREALAAHHQKHGLTERDNHKLIRSITDRVKVEPAVVSEPLTERCRRIVDAMMSYNDAVFCPALRWYVNTYTVRDLLGGPSSGVDLSLVKTCLASWQDEITAHHLRHGLAERDNYKSMLGITQCVKVEPAVVYEPLTERCRRATDAIIAYNDTVLFPALRWYISPAAVYALLGGPSSGIGQYRVKHYLSYRRDEIAVHHQKHGLAPGHNRKPARIAERVKVEPAVMDEHYIERCQRATDAILAYNERVSSSSFRWYIYAAAVLELLGRKSGIEYSLVQDYLASRHREITAHNQQYGLTHRNHAPYFRSLCITDCVKVEPAVVYEPLTARCGRAVEAIMAYNDATFSPTLRWYISEYVVSTLLGGSSSGVDQRLVKSYLADRHEELTAHHQKHGLTASDNNKTKLLCINEQVKVAIEPEKTSPPAPIG